MFFVVTSLSFTLLILLCGSNMPTSAQAASRHHHSGRMEPYTLNPPSIVSLTTSDQQTLARGEPVRTKWQLSHSERDVIIQDVDAPPDVVLSKILDYDNYKRMVPDALDSTLYEKDTTSEQGQHRYRVCIQSGTSLFKINFFTDVIHDVATRTLAWTLDYNQKSDVDDLIGCKYSTRKS
jgi:hypothetical protein